MVEDVHRKIVRFTPEAANWKLVEDSENAFPKGGY